MRYDTNGNEVTSVDEALLRSAWRNIEFELNRDMYDGPHIVVLGSGYADVHSDGSVTQHGAVVLCLDCNGAVCPESLRTMLVSVGADLAAVDPRSLA